MRKIIKKIPQAAGPFLVGAAFFLTVCLSSASTVKVAGMALALGAVAAVLLRGSAVRGRLYAPVLLLAAVVVMDGVSTLYAVTGKFALYEFLKVFASFCLVVILLAAAPGEGARPGRWIAAVLETNCALAGLVSMDLLSTRWLSGALVSALGRVTPDYSQLAGVEPGVRMLSIFTNPNTFAGCAGLGVLLSLGLVSSSERGWERRAHLSLLFVNALSFVLAFSLGASGAIAVAFLVFLALEGKERRGGLLIVMVETLVLTVLAAGVISQTSLQPWDGVDPIPLVCTVLGGAALCLLDRFAGKKLADKLLGRGRLVLCLIAGVLAVLIAFGAVAVSVTGPVTLQPGEGLRRAAYPQPGTYTLSVQGDAPLEVVIESQNQAETMMHTSTVLYAGAGAEAVFTVPADSLVVYFNLSAPEGGTISRLSFAGEGGSGKVPLHYRLLPGFIANRLQGLLANENAIQRLVFFSDGLKLFRQSPVIGLGMGAFESGAKSVQSFYYETKYAHNHYVQLLVETGVVGLGLFLALLAGCAWAVWLSRRSERVHPLTPALGAALVFAAIHGGTEVVFSAYPYLPLAFGVFGLINLCCGAALPAPRLGGRARRLALAGMSVLITAYAVLLGGNMAARRLVSEAPSLESLERAVKLDRFEWADYMLSYVHSVTGKEVEEPVREQADAYAARLTRVDSNTIPIYLARYYFSTGRVESGFAMVEKYVEYVAADPAAWQKGFDLLAEYEADTQEFRTGVIRLAGKLAEWNREHMGEISLNEAAQSLISRMSP